ncbi:MAG TPA: hypothetical protein VK845_00320 [Gemmatimonadales bacterium]|nr:hypothetical protein [Gemmatimonadales bacterium]
MGKIKFLAACAVMVVASAAQLSGQVRVGGQINFADDFDFGLGPRIVVADPALGEFRFIGTFDLYFPDDRAGVDIDYWEINGNVVYDFAIQSAPTLVPYVGAGLNIAHISGGTGFGSDTDIGANLLGGMEFKTGRLRPFVELRVELEGGEQFVVTGGLLF